MNNPNEKDQTVLNVYLSQEQRQKLAEIRRELALLRADYFIEKSKSFISSSKVETEKEMRPR